MKYLRKVADGFIGLTAAIGAVGLFFEVVLILADVVLRFFGKPIVGAQDLSQMTMTIVVFGGMALCDKLGGHIAVDLLENHLPPWINHLTNVVSAFLGALIFGCIAWTVYESSKLSIMLHLATNIIALPKAWFQWIVSLFAAITAFAMAVRGLEMIIDGTGQAAEHKRVEL